MEEKERQMFVAEAIGGRQDMNERVPSEPEKRVSLDHAERGQFIPFAEVLKKLG